MLFLRILRISMSKLEHPRISHYLAGARSANNSWQCVASGGLVCDQCWPMLPVSLRCHAPIHTWHPPSLLSSTNKDIYIVELSMGLSEISQCLLYCIWFKKHVENSTWRSVPIQNCSSLLAADSSSSSPNVVCLLSVVYQVEKLLANCYLTAT